MHVVIWTSKGQRYATPSSSIIEVIPVVQSRPVVGSEDWLQGLFDYRGRLLPLVDSSRLLGHTASEIRMASRILVIRPSDDTQDDRHHLGLIVEQVLGSEDVDFDKGEESRSCQLSSIAFLGPVACIGNSTVQLTTPSRLPTCLNQQAMDS
ncbi:chemotaxis protein CheW [Novipirellula artificiosorum]|uniref:CheW-like domain protein n=1 Tax=Novipirellula artificiosorum TaxID=2528016 RepID=A0A5C6D414_9BACT|nr:chemotaxis protein CheW [Novipirellula artificiosorum]TWU30825.1 CheW-like domain protein [Novipirellula artificiosorum]